MKKNRNYFITIIGVLLIGIGLYLLKMISKPQGIMLPLPYVCIGIGCGIFGHGIGDIISKKILKNNLEIARQIKIEANDERNIAIENRAKAKAFDMMIFVFGALLISFVLMNVGIMATLFLVSAYLFMIGYKIYYSFKYNKEM